MATRHFIEMMHEFVQQHLNQNATTESFQAVAEKHMTPGMDVEGNHRLDWFFREWVYGTALPEYKFESVADRCGRRQMPAQGDGNAKRG